jgi:hypothetical protein
MHREWRARPLYYHMHISQFVAYFCCIVLAAAAFCCLCIAIIICILSYRYLPQLHSLQPLKGSLLPIWGIVYTSFYSWLSHNDSVSLASATTPAYPYMAIGAAVRAKGSWGCVRTAYLSDYSTEILISWPKNMPDVPNVHARQTRLPRCKCN